MSWVDEVLKVGAQAVFVKEQVDEALKEWRLNICAVCPSLIKKTMQCAECGCYLEIKAGCKVNRSKKRPLGEITHCPLGKWKDKEIANHYREQDGREPIK